MSNGKSENPDPLAEMILDLNARLADVEKAWGDLRVLVMTLAEATGYELELVERQGGLIGAKWSRKSKLVTL